MAFLETTDDIVAYLTVAGRHEMARMLLGEVAVHFVGFQVGRGGYRYNNPVKIDPVDITATGLIDPVPNASVFRPLVTIEQPIGLNVVSPVCRLSPGESDAQYGLGELGIFVEYDRDTVNPGNIGTKFLFALAHFPMVSKTPTHTFVWRIIIAL